MVNCVIQEDENGCALACIASITGKTYQEVKQDINSKTLKHILNTGLAVEEVPVVFFKYGYLVLTFIAKEVIVEMATDFNVIQETKSRWIDSLLLERKLLVEIVKQANIPALIEVNHVCAHNESDINTHTLVWDNEKQQVWNPATANWSLLDDVVIVSITWVFNQIRDVHMIQELGLRYGLK